MKPYPQCYVRACSTIKGAIFIAQESVHPSKWTEHDCDAITGLRMRRAYRNRDGVFEASQRRGYFVVTFTPDL